MEQFLKKRFTVLALLAMFMLAPTAHAQYQTTLRASSAPAGSQDAEGALRRVATDPFVRTELFFGADRPNDTPDVSEDDFRWFLDQEVTPQFPDGLTLITGRGQFRNSDDVIVREGSFVLILLYPLETAKESSKKIERIREAYKQYFQQQSVLRVDDPRPVRVSF